LTASQTRTPTGMPAEPATVARVPAQRQPRARQRPGSHYRSRRRQPPSSPAPRRRIATLSLEIWSGRCWQTPPGQGGATLNLVGNLAFPEPWSATTGEQRRASVRDCLPMGALDWPDAATRFTSSTRAKSAACPMASKPNPAQALKQAAASLIHSLDAVAWAYDTMSWEADEWQAELLRFTR
jgi:hypothetical protein